MTETLLTSTNEAPAAVAENATVVETTAAPVSESTTTTSSSWLDSLSDDLKSVKSLQNFKSAEDLAKSYVNASSLLGKKVSEWAKEDVQALYTKLGRPETKDGYVLPDEVGADVRELAYEAGLTQEQAKILADKIAIGQRLDETQTYEAGLAQIAEAEKILKAEWGTAYDTRLQMAKQAALELGGSEFLNAINDAGLGTNPAVLKTLAKIGVEFLRGDRVVNADKQTTFGIVPAEAQNQISSLKQSKEFAEAFSNINHPNHKDAVLKWEELHRHAYAN